MKGVKVAYERGKRDLCKWNRGLANWEKRPTESWRALNRVEDFAYGRKEGLGKGGKRPMKGEKETYERGKRGL